MMKTSALSFACAMLCVALVASENENSVVYFTTYQNSRTCSSEAEQTLHTNEANTCLHVTGLTTKDTQLPVTGMIYECPAQPAQGDCGTIEIFSASGCNSESYTSEIPCNVCQGDPSGFHMMECDGGSIAVVAGCDETCGTCTNKTVLTAGECTELPGGDPKYIKAAENPVDACSHDFISMTFLVRGDKNAATSPDQACLTSDSSLKMTKRVRFVEADTCVGGTIASCNDPAAKPPTGGYPPPPTVYFGEVCPATEHPLYDMAELPYDCFELFSECSSGLCACAGLSWDPAMKMCMGNNRRSDDACSALPQCAKDYVQCVNMHYLEAEDLGIASNCTTDAAAFNFYHDQALQNVISPDWFNQSDLFGSCQNFACNLANKSMCEINAVDVCAAPPAVPIPITPVPGSTPAPTNPDGSYAVPTKIVRVVVVFTADFDSLVSTPAGKKKIKDTMTDALTKKLQYKTVAKLFTYLTSGGVTINSDRRKQLALAAGSLSVTGEATIPASDTATLASVSANANALANDKSTSWYAGLSAACGCTIPAPTVTSSVVDGASASQPPSSPSSSGCAAGCVAGVVVGGTAAVTIGVGAVAYVSMKKAATVAPVPEVQK